MGKFKSALLLLHIMQSLLLTFVMMIAAVGGRDASVRGSLWRRRRRRVLALCPGRLPAAPLGVVKLGEHMKPSPMRN
jgi:hypothetical protein